MYWLFLIIAGITDGRYNSPKRTFDSERRICISVSIVKPIYLGVPIRMNFQNMQATGTVRHVIDGLDLRIQIKTQYHNINKQKVSVCILKCLRKCFSVIKTYHYHPYSFHTVFTRPCSFYPF